MADELWKKKPVSPKQSEFLEKLGYKGKMPKNAGEASDLINKYVMIQNAEKLREKVDYDLTEDVMAIGKEVIGHYSYIMTLCIEAGITEGQVVGMIFNNFKADLRAKTNN